MHGEDAARIGAGRRPLDRIDPARELGKDPSTVAYWVRKHGLASAHAARHAARGGIQRAALVALVDQGLSSYAIAQRLGVSQSTVRHWLKRYGLTTTARYKRHKILSTSSDGTFISTCHRHGATRFLPRDDGGHRCLLCRSAAVVARRRKVKRILVQEVGGQCALCGYSRSMAALQFHHLDRDAKEFELSFGGFSRSLARMRAEAAKCVLLCANCHSEVEAGVATIRSTLPGRPLPG